MFERIEDTIVAVGTPLGAGIRGVVRISGPGAMHVAARMFRAHDESSVHDGAANRCLYGRVSIDDHQFVLPAELFIFRAPRSYTREDVAELHTVSAPAVLSLLVDRACTLGARLAEAGEFTARAFYHGALDLSAVEGLKTLLQARSDQQLRAARQWLDGHLAAEIGELRQQLVQLLALVEADIDFAEEPIEFLQPHTLHATLEDLTRRMSELLDRAHAIEHVRTLPRVMLVGRPNVGKSTLMNRLSGVSRAICSPLAGTTRDLLTTIVTLPQGEIELIDTAGLGQNAQIFQKKSNFFFRRELPLADVVCHLLDLTATPLENGIIPDIDQDQRPVLWVANKVDLIRQHDLEGVREWFTRRRAAPLHIISAQRGDGLAALRQSLSETVFGSEHDVAAQRFAIGATHRGHLAETRAALHRAQGHCANARATSDCAEWVANDLRTAINELGTIFGAVTTDDLLRHIFEGFCIGK